MRTNKGTMIGQGWELPVFTAEEGAQRWKRIRERIYDRMLDCLIISGSTYNFKECIKGL